MIPTRWLEKRKQQWSRLEELLGTASRHGIRNLPQGELRDLGLLYRQAAADLSILREDSSTQHHARYLNQLLGRAHNTIYAAPKSSARAIPRFYWNQYPRIFRRNLNHVTAATLLFVAGALLGMLVTAVQPGFMHQLLGPHMVDTIERRQMWTHSILAMKPVAASGIMTNNLGVAFTAFAAGITGGVGTIYMLTLNGVLLGVIGTACWFAGMSMGLWSFVAAHGSLELPAIFIAGGAGLRLAHGLLFPGLLSRRESLEVAGGEAVRLLLGVIPMLIIAGVIEGFVSPTAVPAGAKLLLGALLLTGLLAYLFLGGSDEDLRSDSAP